MSHIIEDLLTIEKSSSKTLTYNFSKFDLSDAFSNVFTQLNPKIEEKHQFISYEIPSHVMIVGDQQRIEQVIRIILDNAIKYSSPNSIISIHSSIDIPSDKTSNEWLLIKIMDQGRGVPKQDISKLFQKFYRSKDVQNIPGTGVGLAIAKEIIEKHNGKISLSSIINEGTIVKIELPLKKRDED